MAIFQCLPVIQQRKITTHLICSSTSHLSWRRCCRAHYLVYLSNRYVFWSQTETLYFEGKAAYPILQYAHISTAIQKGKAYRKTILLLIPALLSLETS